MNKKKLYLVYADTYEELWGSEISAFGIFDSKEKAEEFCEKANM